MTEVSSSPHFRTSLSAFQVWQRCEMRYYYGYIRKLQLPDKFPAPTLGRLLHDYLEIYYNGVREGHMPDDAHLAAQLVVSRKYVPEVRAAANVAFMTGNEALAKELTDIPAAAGRITDRYYLVHGKSDADRYNFMYVEKWLSLQVSPGILSTGKTDLVTQDNETGRISIWEHKSTKNIPQDSVRLRDFQTMLYAMQLRWETSEIVDSVIWNYIRTKEPVVPEQLKSGDLTKRKDLDSTWEVYSAAVKALHGNPDTPRYDEIRSHLEGREQTIFFPRYEQVIVVEEKVLMDDYIEEGKRMWLATESWKAGTSKPVRTLARDCDMCEFYRICQAALMGGDEEDIIQMRYVEGK